MSHVATLDEITEQLGPPAYLRWVNTPYAGTAAVARFRHRGAQLDLSASGVFRVIFHLSNSDVETREDAEHPARRLPRSGSIITSASLRRERIHILGAADTLHLFFSPEFTEKIRADTEHRISRAVEPALRASAVQALVGLVQPGADAQLEHAVSSMARTLAQSNPAGALTSGGLSPQASRVVHDLLNVNFRAGVGVAALAEAAGLSLHHFIKMCHQTEGCTPHALLLQKRMERATALLSNSRARVEEVAMNTGFSSPSHFVSTFRRLTGVTPAVFRQAVAG